MHAIYMHIIPSSFSPSDRHSYNNMQMHEQTDKHTGSCVIYRHTHRRSDMEGVPHSTLLLRLIRVVMNAPDSMCAGHLWFSVIIYLCV